MAIPTYARPYIICGIELADPLFQELLSKVPSDDPFWDFRPNPDRFTLREAIAHVADWNEIFQERIEATRDQDHPTLPDKDEREIAIERDYAHSDPQAALARLSATRKSLVEVVKALTPGDWDRTAHKENLGDLSIEQQIALIGGHDAYHIKQVLEYRQLYQK